MNFDKSKYKEASFRQRFAAMVLDGAIMTPPNALVIVLVLLLGRLAGALLTTRVFLVMVALICSDLKYLIWSVRRFEGATLGKHLLGLKVVSKTGESVPIRRCVVREVLGKLVFTFGAVLSVVPRLFGKRWTLHDWLCQTRVVMRDSSDG